MPKSSLFKLRAVGYLILLLNSNLSFAHDKQPGEFVFIENKGQWEDEVLFKADVPAGSIVLQKDRITYLLKDHSFESEETSETHSHNSIPQKYTQFDVEFLNYAESKIVTAVPEVTNYNYYLGKDKSTWGENCKSYRSIKYQNLYQDIDLIFYFNERNQLKYDLILKPGSSPASIEFKYSKNVELLLEDGCVFAKSGQHSIMENRPVTYQVDKFNNKVDVECLFELKNNKLSYKIPEYDQTKPVIIDPELVFSTFSGSFSENFGHTACYDDQGSLYSGGIVFGPNFPNTTGTTHNDDVDMGILKYSADGSQLLYATYIGGNLADAPHSMITNNENELVILGSTGSQDFPTTTGAYDDTFNGGDSLRIHGFYYGSDIAVSKLNQTGNLIASTYIGGSETDGVLKVNLQTTFLNDLIINYGDSQRGDLAVDTDGNIYVASSTESEDFPVTSNIQPSYAGGISDAVVFSLNPGFQELRWSTYLGGSADDAAYSIKLDGSNNVLVGGGTLSSDFPSTSSTLNPTHQGSIDGFITKIDPTNDQILQSTFLGTDLYDQVYFIDIDSSGMVYAFGQTLGVYPVTSGSFSIPDGTQFIHKLSADLSTTDFSTVFGSGSRVINISPTAFLVNECENIFLSGWGGDQNIRSGRTTVPIGQTFNLPVTNDAFMPTTDGDDFYLMVLSADGSELLYGTYFGSTNSSGDHVDGGTSRFDKKGIIYQSVCSCGGSSDSFPVTAGVWSLDNQANCNNASFKFDLASLDSRFITNSPLFDQPGITTGCVPFEIVFINTSVGGQEFLWEFGDGGTSNSSESVSHTYNVPGNYQVSLTIWDDRTCKKQDISFGSINVFDDQVTISNDTTICEGESVQLEATGGEKYQWTPEVEFSDPYASNPIVSPNESSNYTVEILTPNGCREIREVEVEVIPILKPEILTNDPDGNQPDVRVGCAPFSVLFVNSTEYDENYIWDFGDGTTSNGPDSIVHTYTEVGTYEVTLQVFSNFTCNNAESTTIMINVYDDIVSATESIILCEGEEQQLFATGGITYNWSPSEGLDNPTSAQPIVSPNNSLTYTVEIVTPNGCIEFRQTEVVVTPIITELFYVEPIVQNCGEQLSYQIRNRIRRYDGTFFWDFGDGNTSTENEPMHSYALPGTFTISLDLDHNCSIDQSIEITNSDIFIPNAFSPNGDGINETFNINYPGPVKLTIHDRNGKKVYQSDNYNSDWSAKNVSAGTYYYNIHFGEGSEKCNGWLQIIK